MMSRINQHLRWRSEWPTLRLHRPADLLTFSTTMAFLLVLLFASEAAVRTRSMQVFLGTPTLGTGHRQFESRWAMLAAERAQDTSIDCVFIGDSTVMTDFAPLSFRESYKLGAGELLDCQNLGVGAISGAGIAALSQIVVDEYSPRYLIIGVQALNFTVSAQERGDDDLARKPWVRQRLGEFTLEGWLYDTLSLARYASQIGRLLAFEDNVAAVLQGVDGSNTAFVSGFWPMEGTGAFDVAAPPDPMREHPYFEHYFAALADYAILPENLQALGTVLDLHGPSLTVVLVEMPVAETFHRFFGNGRKDYEAFIAAVEQEASRRQIPFLRPPNALLSDPAYWFNYNHLNSDGAPIFSRWLGTAVARNDNTASR